MSTNSHHAAAVIPIYISPKGPLTSPELFTKTALQKQIAFCPSAPQCPRMSPSIRNAAHIFTAFKHRDYSSIILCPSQYWVILWIPMQGESSQGLLASISSQVLYHLGKVCMYSIYLLIAKSGFCHSLSRDSCACTDLKKVTAKLHLCKLPFFKSLQKQTFEHYCNS